MNIIHLPRKVSQTPMPPDVRPLAWALSRMEPESLALILPGESLDDCRARRAAGLDILNELLAEFPTDGLDGDGDPVDALSALLTLGGAA
jgi:hypothetical protein